MSILVDDGSLKSAFQTIQTRDWEGKSTHLRGPLIAEQAGLGMISFPGLLNRW